jgi:hypothetical protein
MARDVQAEGGRVLLFPGAVKRGAAGRGPRSHEVKVTGLPSGTIRIDGPRRRRVKASELDVFIGDSTGIHVSLHRASDGTSWIAVVSQTNGAAPVPWPVRVTHEGANSATLAIECPVSAPISWSVTEP